MHCSELVSPFHLMESWTCVSGGKVLGSDDVMSHSSSIGGGGSKNDDDDAPVGWDLWSPMSDFNHDTMVSTQFRQLSVTSDGPLCGVNGSSSNFGQSAHPADGRDPLFIDLKLGHDSEFPQGIPISSSSESSTHRRRIRSGRSSSQVAYCQVYGCNKDLSSCKGYHKKHRICELHSKTAIVIVNGIEQRFCQQCSRFHLLAEFDESKRSCRSRLAGHNERRRKSQLSVQAGRIGRLLQPYSGNMFQSNSSRASSLICPDIIFSGSLLNSDQDVGAGNLSGCINVENRHHSSKSLYSYGKPFNFFNDGDASIGTEEYTLFDTASTIQALSGIPESGCVLSLLSSESQSSSYHSSGIPMSRQPLIATGIDYQSTSHASYQGLSDKASFLRPGERRGANSLLISDSISFGFPDGTLHEPELTNIKDGTTINSLQLSLQLQQVEDQRQFI